MRLVRWVLCGVFSFAGSASAGVITDLFNTGVDGNGVPLPEGTTPDPHYTIISSTDGSVANTTCVNNNPGDWLNGNSVSSWITPGTVLHFVPNGPFDYRTTFTLPSNVASITISANLGADDLGPAILLNGQSVGAPDFGGFGSLTPISFTSSDVVVGTNTLTFDTLNADPDNTLNPTGLRVDGIVGTYTSVPEPSALLLFGVVSLMLLVRRSSVRTRTMLLQ